MDYYFKGDIEEQATLKYTSENELVNLNENKRMFPLFFETALEILDEADSIKEESWINWNNIFGSLATFFLGMYLTKTFEIQKIVDVSNSWNAFQTFFALIFSIIFGMLFFFTSWQKKEKRKDLAKMIIEKLPKRSELEENMNEHQ